MVKDILQYPNDTLDTICETVDVTLPVHEATTFAVIADLFDTVDKGVLRPTAKYEKNRYRTMLGLAANQIGVPLRIAVVSHAGLRFAMVNSQVEIKSEAGDWFAEGCMSLPESTLFRIWRPNKVKITNTWWWNREKEKYDVRDIKLVDFEARIALHELDHLNGLGIEQRMKFNSEYEDNCFDYEWRN